jgi:hypothetical protein
MADINELAEKKLKSRMTKIRKCNRDEAEKEKFFNQLGTSFTIFFPNRNPDKLTDGLNLYTGPDGRVLFADYFYQIPENEEDTTVEVSIKDLKSIVDALDDFKFQLDE